MKKVLDTQNAASTISTKNKEQRTKNKEQRTKNKEQRTKNKEQRTKNKEQRTKNKEQRTKNKEGIVSFVKNINSVYQFSNKSLYWYDFSRNDIGFFISILEEKTIWLSIRLGTIR
ncbi:hypothetical protein [Treponema saccharophilum]|uniref:hypothetical protein n=1 Tax=Treponema saccharophilum TaxID=165 RepID=UPI0030C67246